MTLRAKRSKVLRIYLGYDKVTEPERPYVTSCWWRSTLQLSSPSVLPDGGRTFPWQVQTDAQSEFLMLLASGWYRKTFCDHWSDYRGLYSSSAYKQMSLWIIVDYQCGDPVWFDWENIVGKNRFSFLNILQREKAP